ncbi:AsmA family protein [Sphingomonas sp. CJ20]
MPIRLPRSRRLVLGLGVVAAFLAVLLIALAAFPWGVLRGTIERRLAAQVGRPVTIGSIARTDAFSFTPTILIRDVRVPQPAWAGTGTLAQVAETRVTFSAWSLLRGAFVPLAIDANGARLTLVRDAQGRKNWTKDKPGGSDGGNAPTLRALTLRDVTVTYRDAKRDRAFAVALTSDAAQGLRIAGTGSVRDTPVTITASAPAIGTGQGKPWPFQALIDGPALRFAARGTMDTPLDTRHMTVDIETRAQDLKLVDAIIAAGLFGTQPVALTAHARRDGAVWDVPRLSGTIGGSRIGGRVRVTKRDGRSILDGAVQARNFAFDDLASNEGKAKAAALRRTIGPRIVPNTRINIRKIDKTDGTIALTVHSFAGATGRTIKGLRGALAIDHQLLTLTGLRVALPRGTVTGSLRVDQRGGVPVPAVTIDLRLANSSIGALAGGPIDGRLDARVNVTGRGSTIREAVGAGNGRIGIVARDGSLPEKLASMMGFDIGAALLPDEGARAGLRCMALGLTLRGGTGTADPLLIDTTRSQARGTGTVRFPAESIALTFTGAPKTDGAIRLPGSATARGTLSSPQIDVPRETKSLGNVLKGLGRAISGKQGPRPADADCGALAARVLG